VLLMSARSITVVHSRIPSELTFAATIPAIYKLLEQMEFDVRIVL